MGALAAGSWQQKDAAKKWQPIYPMSDGVAAYRAQVERLEQITQSPAEGVPYFGGFDAMELDSDDDDDVVSDFTLMKKNAARLSQAPSKKKAGGRGGKGRGGGRSGGRGRARGGGR